MTKHLYTLLHQLFDVGHPLKGMTLSEEVRKFSDAEEGAASWGLSANDISCSWENTLY